MQLLRGMSRALLLVTCMVILDTRDVMAVKQHDLYVSEFLRLTDSTAIWNDESFIEQLNGEIQRLTYDGLNPEKYLLSGLDILDVPLVKGDTLSASQRYRVAASYLSVLTDLHYGRTFQAGIEPYLIYPEGKQALAIDPSRILNMALSGVDDPADAFKLARPQYPPYERLRAAYQFSQTPQLEIVGLLDTLVESAIKEEVPPFMSGPASLAKSVLPGPLSDDQHLKVQINLERFRRMSHMITDQLLLVDIAGAELALYDGDSQPVVRQSSQIGRVDRQTPLMWSEITHITVNPFWTVPPTVYREDMLPQIRRNLSYLEDNQLQVLDFDGRSLNPASINWRNPGRILLRQAPGDQNELGRIVVRFPNNEAIFLHDTPSQGYFSQDMRALSSGCIRLQEAPALAEKLLTVSSTDATDKLEQLLSTGATQELFLDQPIPVLLAYWTVEADAEMGLHFRPDIYGLDGPMQNFFKDRVELADR